MSSEKVVCAAEGDCCAERGQAAAGEVFLKTPAYRRELPRKSFCDSGFVFPSRLLEQLYTHLFLALAYKFETICAREARRREKKRN